MFQIYVAPNILDDVTRTIQLKFLAFEEEKYTVFTLDITSFPFLQLLEKIGLYRIRNELTFISLLAMNLGFGQCMLTRKF